MGVMMRKVQIMCAQLRAMPVRGSDGQMAVELAVTMPVMIVVMVITIDLMVFLGDCARFDRVAPELVRAAVASPAVDGAGNVAGVVEAGLRESCGGEGRLGFHVSDEGGIYSGSARSSSGTLISLVPQPHRYRVVLEYTPWPFKRGAFGFSPGPLTHEKTYVADPYRFGVVV